MSGYTDGLLTSQGVPGTVSTLLDKPFDQARLLEALRDVLISD
jgi:hypothetical protein